MDLPPVWIRTTLDGFLAFQLALAGVIPVITSEVSPEQRHAWTKSGQLIVWDETSFQRDPVNPVSGKVRWHHSVSWSNSRMIGNFMIYRQVHEKGQPKGELAKRPSGVTDQDLLYDVFCALKQHKDYPAHGLMRKTMTVNISGRTLHLINYYEPYAQLNPSLALPQLSQLRECQEYIYDLHEDLFRATYRRPPLVNVLKIASHQHLVYGGEWKAEGPELSMHQFRAAKFWAQRYGVEPQDITIKPYHPENKQIKVHIPPLIDLSKCHTPEPPAYAVRRNRSTVKIEPCVSPTPCQPGSPRVHIPSSIHDCNTVHPLRLLDAMVSDQSIGADYPWGGSYHPPTVNDFTTAETTNSPLSDIHSYESNVGHQPSWPSSHLDLHAFDEYLATIREPVHTRISSTSLPPYDLCDTYESYCSSSSHFGLQSSSDFLQTVNQGLRSHSIDSIPPAYNQNDPQADRGACWLGTEPDDLSSLESSVTRGKKRQAPTDDLSDDVHLDVLTASSDGSTVKRRRTHDQKLDEYDQAPPSYDSQGSRQLVYPDSDPFQLGSSPFLYDLEQSGLGRRGGMSAPYDMNGYAYLRPPFNSFSSSSLASVWPENYFSEPSVYGTQY